MAGYYAWSRIDAGSLVDGYKRLAGRTGLDRLYLILSFDCDRESDIAAAWEVHGRLMDMGICPAYAVPGELLAKGASVYRRIAETGAEFLNHGYRDHMYFNAKIGLHESCFFYDQQPEAVLASDITQGDKAVTEIIGKKPRGFRTPHFGTFQKDRHLRFLHRVLTELDYDFSTSTTPVFGLRFGPLFRRYGLTEIPVSGRGTMPFELLDSWGCFEAPGRVLGAEDYRRDAVRMSERLSGGPGLLNYYADPSHIVDQPIFFDTMRELIKVAQPTTYRDVVGRFA
jgi:hypothetical protein